MVDLDLNTNIGDILAKYPKSSNAFREFDIPTEPCCGSIKTLNTTVEQAAQRYQINPQTLLKALEIVIDYNY